MSDTMTPRELDDAGRIHLNHQGYRNRAAHESMLANAERGLNGARSLNGVFAREANKLSADATSSPELKAVNTAVREAATLADAAWIKMRTTLTDDTMAPEGRTRIANETLTEARAKIAEQVDRAAVNTEVARARLTTEAIGTPSKDREAFARQDAEATLAGAPDPLAAITSLAQDPDPDIRALAAGPWGTRRLQASGVDHLDTHLAAIRKAATEAARTHGTGRRKQAADTLSRLTSADALVAYASNYAHLALDGFDTSNNGR
jgi:hypothetical protein